RQWSTMTLEDVFLHRELSYSLLRAGVGVCGALVVYFFLRSGIAEGALFPDFTKVAIEWVSAPAGALPMTFVAPSKALALLTFWCFLAGFSEALVPSILSNTERQLTDATAPEIAGLTAMPARPRRGSVAGGRVTASPTARWNGCGVRLRPVRRAFPAGA